MSSKNRFGVSLKDLQALRDDMEKYHKQLEASGSLWKEAFKLQELEFEIEAIQKSINQAFDFVIENASSNDAGVLSQLQKNKLEFNSLVHGGRINKDEF